MALLHLFYTSLDSSICGEFCFADTCTNDDADCDNWASVGECDANPDWMGSNCKRACHQCDDDNDDGNNNDDDNNDDDDDGSGEVAASRETDGDESEEVDGSGDINV